MFSVNYDEIKERVCDFRKASKSTQQDVALYLNMKRASYRAKEADGTFDWDETVQLAELFNTSPVFIRYGVEDDDVKVIAKILRNKPTGTRLMQPKVTIFDDLEKYQEDTRLYLSYLNLDTNEQNRIIRYINSSGF